MRNILLCLFAAVSLTMLLPTKALEGAATGLLAFVGLLIGMLMPTMALNASALRAGRASPRYARRTGRALLVQFDFWVTMLWLSLCLAGLLILGSVVDWNDAGFTLNTRIGTVTCRPIELLNGAIWFVLGLLTIKLRGFVVGFRSLLRLHVRQVLDEVRSLDPAKDQERQLSLKSREFDPDFGKMID